MKRVFTLSDKAHGPGGIFFSWQKSQGNYLATTGYNEIVNIYDRHGKPKDSIHLPGMCSGLGWDKDGDILSIITDKSPLVFFWDANTQKTFQMDSSFKDPLSLLLWARNSTYLAVGSNKGNLLIYNHQSSRKVPVLGKHTKKITCGAWSSLNLLALGSDDRQLTISNTEGDTVRQIGLRAEPTEMQFSEIKTDERSSGENTVSMVLGAKTLFLFNLEDPDNPIELAFQTRYGNIVSYKWYGDGYIMIGFQAGFLVCISTHVKEIGQELFQTRDHKDSLTSIAINYHNNKVASCGDNNVKVHDLGEPKDVLAIVEIEEERLLNKVAWTEDGQLMTVSSNRGFLYIYLAQLPSLGDAYLTRIAYLTSLLEVTILDPSEGQPPSMVHIEVEPSFIAIGPYALAVGMNNRVWYYFLDEQNKVVQQKDREYLGTIKSLKLNDGYAAVHFVDGKVHLHMLDGDGDGEQESKMFPEDERDKITSLALTQDFLIYSTEKGCLYFFLLEDWAFVDEYKHMCAITKMSPDNFASTRVAFIDEKCDGFIYNPVAVHTIEIPTCPNTARELLWESVLADRGVFCAYDTEQIYLYTYTRMAIGGPQCTFIGTTKLPYGHTPMSLYGTEVTCLTQGGKHITLQLDQYKYQEKLSGMPPTAPGASTAQAEIQELKAALKKMQQLRHWQEAYNICQVLNVKDLWQQLEKQHWNI